MEGMTVEEAANRLQISRVNVRAAIRRGKLAARRIGQRVWLIDAESVEQFAREREEREAPVSSP